MKKILCSGLLSGFVLCHLISGVSAQEKHRGIREPPPLAGTPIEVVGRQIGSRSFDKGKSIRAGRDWLRGLTLHVQNTFRKNVIYFSLQFHIPPTGNMGSAGRIFSISFGNEWGDRDTYTDARGIRRDVLAPGEVVRVRIDDTQFANLEKYLRMYDAENVEVISMDIRQVHFDDGTGWSFGNELRKDPNDATKWITVTPLQSARYPSLVSGW